MAKWLVGDGKCPSSKDGDFWRFSFFGVGRLGLPEGKDGDLRVNIISLSNKYVDLP